MHREGLRLHFKSWGKGVGLPVGSKEGVPCDSLVMLTHHTQFSLGDKGG